jgi:hypothetical protein
MAVVKVTNFGTRFADALGLKGQRVRRLEVRLEKESIIVATVELFPDESQLEAVEKLIREYNFVERESPEIRSFDQ